MAAWSVSQSVGQLEQKPDFFLKFHILAHVTRQSRLNPVAFTPAQIQFWCLQNPKPVGKAQPFS
jgi:hypothetical protein